MPICVFIGICVKTSLIKKKKTSLRTAGFKALLDLKILFSFCLCPYHVQYFMCVCTYFREMGYLFREKEDGCWMRRNKTQLSYQDLKQ